MRKPGGQSKHSDDVKAALVRRYLHTDVSAEELSVEVGVSESTVRRWVRQFRADVDQPPESGGDTTQGRLPIPRTG